MSVISGPNTNTSGLIFEYDMANIQKSWKGKPTVNLIANTGADAELSRSADGSVYGYFHTDITSYVLANWTASNNKFSMSFEGKRDYSVGGTGGGGDGYPRMYIYFGDWSWAADFGISTYDWSYDKLENITMPDPTGKSVHFSIYHMNAGNPGRSYSRKHQVEFGTFATPFTNGTRSNTQSIIDLTGNTTITVNSLTYNADGSFSFNSGNYDRITSSTSLFNRSNGQEITVSCWIKPSRLYGQYSVFCTNRSLDNNSYNWIFYQHVDDGAISFHGSVQNKTTYIPTVNTWVEVTNTVTSAGVSTLYVNGVSTFVANGYTYGGQPSLLSIGADASGSEAFQGSINSVKIYNRALSAEEVLNNFNALRRRFGL